MIKYLLFLMLLICGNSWAVTCSTPSSSYTYINGTTILPNQVQTNENNMYSYLQTGVCAYQAGSITQAAVSSTAGILYSQLNLSGGILPGDFNTTTTTSIYQLENLTVPYNFTVGSTPTTGSILYFTAGTNGYVNTTMGYSGPTYPYVKVSETETSGTAGGTSSTGAWNVRVLNTKDVDTSAIGSLSGNQLTLPAGTYQTRISSSFYSTLQLQIRLYNVTASSVLLIGQSVFGIANGGVIDSISGQFTLSTSSAVAVQYQVNNGVVTNGLGYPSSFGTEVYTTAEFIKVS